ncbi:MAG: hypothetical protein RJA76_484 [Bacteroidota bacterium]|jgi:hypothetical protein
MQKDLELNVNLIMLKIQIDALKSVLSNDQKTKFNNELYSKRLEILTKYKDNELLRKSKLEDLFKQALVEI